MKGYQNMICKTLMLQYNNHYSFIHLVLWRIRYTFSIATSSQKKKRKRKNKAITILYMVRCRQLDTHTTHEKCLKLVQKKRATVLLLL